MDQAQRLGLLDRVPIEETHSQMETTQTIVAPATDPAQLVEDIIKKEIFGTVLKAVIARAITAMPFLAWPVVNQVFIFVVSRCVDAFYQELAKVVTFAVIDFQTEAERRAYDLALSALHNAVDPPGGIPNAKEIEAARQALRDRLAKLIHLSH